MKKLFITSFVIWLAAFSYAQNNIKYQTPPKSIAELAEASFPSVSFSKDGRYMLILNAPGFESIEQASQPVLGLAGLKFNPSANTLEPESGGTYDGITIKEVATGQTHTLSGLPAGFILNKITWSPDATKFAFGNKTLKGIELWVADLSTFSARKIYDGRLNNAYGRAFQWLPDGSGILAQTISENRGNPPAENLVPSGPVVQQNLGTKTPNRTYQYLLQTPYDEQLMDYYLTSDLRIVNLDGTSKIIYKPGIFRTLDYSPDGNFLLVETIQHPYSYLVPIYNFPYHTIVLDKNGHVVKELNKTPLGDKTPIAFDAVAAGPRSYQWRKDVPSTLLWVEALDGGNPANKTEYMDAVFTLASPFESSPKKLYSTKLRYGGINWISADYAIINESSRRTNTAVMTLINPESGVVIKEIANRSSEDTYSNPGRFYTSSEEGGSGTLLTDKSKGKSKTLAVFTTSTGASPQGDRPFVMRWDLLSGKTDTLFKSKAPFYESPVFFNNTGVIYFSRESLEKQPDYFAVSLKTKKETALTNFPDPYPRLQGVEKSQISYKRGDGITLTGTMYLPAGYKKENGPLPVLVWAYPREYKTVEAAGQVKGSPYRFPRISWGSPIYWVTRGYAVIDNADMPIVGTGNNYPNDTFVEQITDNANSLINYVVGLGIGDRKRFAVGGHSYGAFMTANLLAHTNLFAAGLARSGAYNRTLTPFGFQNETRTFWQAPDVYGKMSPFYYADKIKTPLLLIHGIDDDNSGTFPIQSERLYSAIKGFGGTVRLVMLPKEFHGYRSRESILHTLWEQDQWLEKYVKNRKP
ncbi:MAG: prolyl oligopeptidase family serine peptidase [Chitinophagaceae bacterium]|nr:prolyl oligopeptidase family serine peptidase [Chitinophagaceae bacterium]